MRPPSFLAVAATTLLFASTLVGALPDGEQAEVRDAAFVPPRLKPHKTKHQDTKYFHEPGGNEVLGHYDIRYFNGQPVTDEQKVESLQYLIRSYLITFRERNIETWIAHGTLLGWWWNGKIMPWDWDLDTQVSAATLTWLGENMNMTMHNYTTVAEDGSEVHRDYLLDVNPNIVERVRGDGMNVIDARWIDTSNGLFIDITGLAETNPSSQPGIWSCKNYHRYRTRDIYPLRETEFEGVPALVPYSFDRVLTDEYSPRALTKTLHQGHRWHPEQKEWLPEPANHITTHPHMPRSIQSSRKPKAGLRNLLNVL
ncbi:mannosylphosphate transferase protein [Rutstroemia sp. NJR-2017a BBW]|nr:mannosylphosphate transferase protein [Rutstroemia sp. NJR-2017a BBW]